MNESFSSYQLSGQDTYQLRDRGTSSWLNENQMSSMPTHRPRSSLYTWIFPYSASDWIGLRGGEMSTLSDFWLGTGILHTHEWGNYNIDIDTNDNVIDSVDNYIRWALNVFLMPSSSSAVIRWFLDVNLFWTSAKNAIRHRFNLYWLIQFSLNRCCNLDWTFYSRFVSRNDKQLITFIFCELASAKYVSS